VVALADEGWRIVRRNELEDRLRREPGGGHGFDNRLESMRGVFFARGPSFRAGVRTPAFENVHVHALLVAALGLESPPTDADLTVVEPLLDPGSR
jgi:hypothetical protein